MHVTGANGIGKTSLLRLICGLTPIEHGDVLWDAASIRIQKESYRRNLCYIGHANALQEAMSVGENLMFYAALQGYEPEAERVRSTLQYFGLSGRGHQLVRHLSQGQKRRVALARLMLTPSRLWVLDEPFVAMDDTGLTMLKDLIADHLAQGGLAVITSHQQVEIGSIPAQQLELAA